MTGDPGSQKGDHVARYRTRMPSETVLAGQRVTKTQTFPRPAIASASTDLLEPHVAGTFEIHQAERRT